MIRSERAHLPVTAVTHPGMTGKNNEDRYAVSAYRMRGKGATPALLAVLADGIGGHRAGEVAAEMVVETISQAVGASDAGDPARILEGAIHAASREVYDLAEADAARRGMGSTCVVTWIIGRRLYAATVGDSRLYLLRSGMIRQLSTDHTWVQEALEQGLLQPDQVAGHPNSHVIRRYMGSPTPPEVDFRLRYEDSDTDAQAMANQGMLLEPGDRLLLCSDGLTDMVEDGEILAAFQAYPQDAAVNNLLSLANERGGLDNITIVAIAIPTGGQGRGALGGRRVWPWGCLGTIALILLAAGIVLAALWASNNGILRGTPTATPTPTRMTSPIVTVTRPVTASRTPTPLGAEVVGTPLPTTGFPATLAPTLTPWPTNTSAPGPTNTSAPGPTNTSAPGPTNTSAPAGSGE